MQQYSNAFMREQIKDKKTIELTDAGHASTVVPGRFYLVKKNHSYYLDSYTITAIMTSTNFVPFK